MLLRDDYFLLYYLAAYIDYHAVVVTVSSGQLKSTCAKYVIRYCHAIK